MPEITERLDAALADQYRIEYRLGEGGMATVYLAEDLKHKRKVAVKVLRPELAAVLGAERFVQEITTTASLQHPHILPLFDSGQVDGFLYYVMPYIEGETLRAKLDRETQLGIDEAVKITTEVADALDYAHRHGVVHRDIKPENILLHDGRPIVADFGIALAVSAAAGGRMTETGLSLGTPHYMSPEQATAAKDITARSDVYSLGSVLYEMLTGEPPHTGGSAQQVIMKIVTDTPRPVAELRKSVPPNVSAAVAKALEKLAADRFATAVSFAEALANPAFTLPATSAAAFGMGSGAQPNRSTIVGWSLAAVMAAVAVWGWMPEAPAPDAPVTRVSLRLPRGQELAANQPFMDLSADGSVLVYSGEDGERGPGPLLVRRLDALDAVPIPGSEGALFPAVSPDNREVAFVVPPAFTMRVVQLQGGVSRTVADSGARWPRWSPEGDWLYYTVVGGGGTLKRVRPGGGVPEVLLSPDTTTGLRAFPEPMPRGRALLYTKQVARSNSVMVMDLVTRETREVVPGGGFPRYRAGFLFYLVGRDERTLMVVPFDVDRLEVRGEPVRLLEGLSSPPTVSETGRLLYTLGTPLSSEYEAVWVTREGQVAAIDPDWTFNPGPNNRGLALSPDGRRLAVSTVANGNLDVWLKELPRGPLSRLTTHPGEDVRPRWTPDGTGVTFVSGRAGLAAIYQKPASGTSDARLLLALDSLAVWEGLPSRDGTWLLARTGGTGLQAGGRDVWAIRSGVDSVPRGLVVTPFDEKALALSPDGRWLAYESDETGRNEVYVRPFPNVNADKVPVSIAGGVAPVWAHSGRELFYLNANREMIAATIGVTNGFAVSERTVLFTLDPSILFREPEQYAMYDIAPGDRRFVMLRAVNVETDRPELILVDNLFGELRAGREN